MTDRAEPWRLWILLSAVRGTLGREILYGWETIAEVRAHADTRLPAFNLRAEHRETGERWNRVQGAWRRVEPRPAGGVREVDLAAPAPAGEGPRYYWQDRD